MKKVLLLKMLLAASIVYSQPIVQPIASGDYWQIDEYKNSLPQVAAKATFPATIYFTNGFIGINSFYVNRGNFENEIVFNVGSMQNVADFVIEWSRDLQTFERAGYVHLQKAADGQYVFKHLFNDNQLVYYRIGIVTAANKIMYTPAAQVINEANNIKVFPTVVKGGAFYIQTAKAFEKLQVINSANQSVYEKGINGVTGTITISLPALSTGVYFVRLLNANQQEHVERIMIQ